MQPGKLYLRTCSWKYDSWIGLVYSQKQRTAAGYLAEYAQKSNTVEIDSWFYKLPTPTEVWSYLEKFPAEFRFTCKVTQEISLFTSAVLCL